MSAHTVFDVEIVRAVSADCLGWPDRDAAGHDRALGGNRQYADLRGCSWAQAQRVLSLEDGLVSRLDASDDREEEYRQLEDELYEDDEGLFGLDIGIASSVIALSASGCIPFSSCNGAAYGGHHHERHPLVAFYARPHHIAVLLQCAEEAGAGLENSGGALLLYADDITKMRAFAGLVCDNRSKFRSARRALASETRPASSAASDELTQLKLPFN